MKRGWLVAAGLLGALALASTADARPPHRAPQSDFDKVGRWSTDYVQVTRTPPLQTVRSKTVMPRTTKAPYVLQKPRKYGDVEGRPLVETSSKARIAAVREDKRRVDRKMMKKMLSDIEQTMQCLDAESCGSFATNRKRPDKRNPSLLTPPSKVDQRLEIKYRKLEGMLMPPLECADMAKCL